MTRKLKYLLLILTSAILTDAAAQNSQLLYFMNIPQSHLLNPALKPSNSVYIGLPVLSGININANNNFVNFKDVFIKGQPKDSIISFLHPDYNVDKFLAKLSDRNFLESESSIQILGIGFSVGRDNYIFFDINDRIDGNAVIPGDLFKLALKGNEQFVGSKVDLSALRADMSYFREYGLGFSRNFTDRLRLGIKAKLLFGRANFSLDNRSLGIAINEDFSHTLDANLAVNMSGPFKVSRDLNNDISGIEFDDKIFDTSSGVREFFMGSKNMGLGMDIGATYDVSDRIVVSASVTDLGFINWKKNINTLKADNQFTFSGLNMLDVVNGKKTIEELGRDLGDSLKTAFTISSSDNPYTTYLPVGISVGGSYSLMKHLTVGLLSYTRIVTGQVREALTLSANANVANALTASISYTAENRQYNNLGAGLALRAGIAQFYLITDRIPVQWNKIKGETKTKDIIGSGTHTSTYNIPVPANWNTFNLRLGMNLVFGNRVREKDDKPMIMVE